MANLSPTRFRAFDSNGDPLAGGKLFTYEAGTSTPKDSFTTEDESVANPNPVILDADGYADVWLGTGFYKLVLTDSADAVIWTIDDVVGERGNDFSSQVVSIDANTNITTVFENNTIVCTDAITLSLLDASTAGDGFYISVRNDSAGNVTVDPDASETINGSATLTVAPGQSYIIVCNGTEWFTLGADFTQDISFSGAATFSGNALVSSKFALTQGGELTISSGAITVTASHHLVDTEGDAASDDLDTINGGIDGQILYLQTANSGRDVTIKHNTGNIVTPDQQDIELTAANKPLLLIWDEADSVWLVVNRDPRSSQAIAIAGTDNNRVMTALRTKQAIDANAVFTESYESTPTAQTSSGTITFAHGLSAAPKAVFIFAEVKSAFDGYSIGDVIPLNMNNNSRSGLNLGNTMTVDATNIKVRNINSNNIAAILEEAAGPFTTATTSNVNLFVRAYL